MNKTVKIITTIVAVLFGGLVFVQSAFAGSLSVRMTQPPSQTNRTDFPVQFVALDINNNPVSVICYKKAPSDGGFSQFGGTVNLSAGGGSGKCDTASVINEDGTYQFYVTGTANGDSVSTGIVSVQVSRTAPGTPVSYHKSKIDSCHYTIEFKTADDGGRTTKVDIYRSDDVDFALDGGSRITTISAGSNETKSYTEGIPDCDKEYYYRIRAVDSYGNFSGSTGDVHTDTIIVTVTPGGSTTSQGTTTSGEQTSTSGTRSQGAIPVKDGQSQVGEEPTGTSGNEEANGSILGQESEATEETKSGGFFLFDWIRAIIEAIKSFFANLFS